MTFRRALAEDDDVLAREHFDGLNPIKRKDGHFSFDLCLRHFVERFDGYPGVFTSIFHKDHAAARLHRAANPLHHLVGKIKFVIHIHQQRQVHRRSRKLRVGYASEDRRDVGKAQPGAEVFEQREHLGLNIHGQNSSRQADGLGQAAAEIARACANVGHDLAGAKLELADQLVGLFFCDALRSFQPVGRFMAHDLGDLTALIKLANTIRVMGLVKIVAVGFAGDLPRPGGQLREQAAAAKANDEEATSPSPAGP